MKGRKKEKEVKVVNKEMSNLTFTLALIFAFMVIAGMFLCANYAGQKALRVEVAELKDYVIDIEFVAENTKAWVKTGDEYTVSRLNQIRDTILDFAILRFNKLEENRKKDIAYQNEVVDVETFNMLYFHGLLKELKDQNEKIIADIWLFKQKTGYSTEEILRRIEEIKSNQKFIMLQADTIRDNTMTIIKTKKNK